MLPCAGLGDIMLTCYGSLSRNRTVGVRLGQGEKLPEILASSSQVAEGVATAGARSGRRRHAMATAGWEGWERHTAAGIGCCPGVLGTSPCPACCQAAAPQPGARTCNSAPAVPALPCPAPLSSLPCPAEVVVNLARNYRVQLPVLTAVAQVVDGHITARQAVFEIMNLPQIEER